MTGTTLIEAPINGWIMAFDGRVLEIFSAYNSGSIRFHVALIVRLWIDGNIVKALFPRQDQGMWPFTESDRPYVERLVAAVEATRIAVQQPR
jgi:hypothetical protein